MRFLQVLALFLVTTTAHAAGPVIWNGSNSKDLSTSGLITNGISFPETVSKSEKATIQAPASLGSNYTLTLPTGEGSANEVMLTSGSGVLTFAQIANANVSNSAAIAYSKLNLATSIVNADVSASAAISGSKLQAASSSNTGTVSYELNGTITATWTGPRTTPSATISYSRVGRIVTIWWARQVNVACGASSTNFLFGTALPVGIRPTLGAGLASVSVNIQEGASGVAVAGPGLLSIDTSGNIRIYRDGTGSAAFSTANTCGFYEGAFTYPVQ